MSQRDIKTVNSVADAYRSMYAKPIEINEDILNEELIDSLIEEIREEETVLSEGMSKPMTLKQYANKIGIDAKEKQWIMDNEKDVQVFHPNNKGRGWTVLSYPVRDNDYYFAFLTGDDSKRVTAASRANMMMNNYLKSELAKAKKLKFDDEPYDEYMIASHLWNFMSKEFEKLPANLGAGDTMTREQLYLAIEDLVGEAPQFESYDYQGETIQEGRLSGIVGKIFNKIRNARKGSKRIKLGKKAKSPKQLNAVVGGVIAKAILSKGGGLKTTITSSKKTEGAKYDANILKSVADTYASMQKYGIQGDVVEEAFKPDNIKGYPRIVDFYIQFRGGKGDRITSKENEKDFQKAVRFTKQFIIKNKLKSKAIYSTPMQGSSAFKVSLYLDKKERETMDLRPLVNQISKLKTAEDHGGSSAKAVKEGVELSLEEGNINDVVKMFPRDMKWKKLVMKHKRHLDAFRSMSKQKDLPTNVEDELISWALDNGEISQKDEVEDFIDDVLNASYEPHGEPISEIVGRLLSKPGANTAVATGTATSQALSASKKKKKELLKGKKEETQLDEVQKVEVDAMKKVSKQMQSVLKSYQAIANKGDKELKDTRHNATYKKVLDARDSVLTMIGTLQTKMLMQKENLDERVSGDDTPMSMMVHSKDLDVFKKLKVIASKAGVKLAKELKGIKVTGPVRSLIAFVELMEKEPSFKKESVQELGEVVNYHTGISGMRIVAAMKKNPVLKKYAIQIPVGKKLNTYDLADILARQMRKFGFDKKEIKAIEDVMQSAYAGVKEELNDKDKEKVKEIIKKLKGASKAHAGQAKDLEKSLNDETIKEGKVFVHTKDPKVFTALQKIAKQTGAKVKKKSGGVEVMGKDLGKGKGFLYQLDKVDIPGFNPNYESVNEKVKDGKLDPLSPMGKSKLTGREISNYYKNNPKQKMAARDKSVKKAIELALDLGGNMNYAMKEIEKFKRGLSKNPAVKLALKHANESKDWTGHHVVLENLSPRDIIKLKAYGSQLAKITKLPFDDKTPEKSIDKLMGQIWKQKHSPSNWERLHKMVAMLKSIGVKMPSLKGKYMGLDPVSKKAIFYKEENNEMVEWNQKIEDIKEGIEELVEKKEMSDADIKKIAQMTDRNDHTGSLMHLAKLLGDRKGLDALKGIMMTHKALGHMPEGLMKTRNQIYDNLMRQSSSKYSNHKDVISSF